MPSPATTRHETGTETRTDEIALIHKIVSGQRDLFVDLIAPHLTSLSSVVRKLGFDLEVEDIIQQATLKALTHLTQFRFEASFRTWLIRIAVNEARQWRRHKKSSRLVKCECLEYVQTPLADQSVSPFAEYQRNETIARVRTALARLPEKYQMVIVLRDVDDLSISEVAVRLGLSVAAVKTRHRRARLKVASLLAGVTHFRLNGHVAQGSPRI